MDQDFFSYLQTLELLLFFSGYPVIYLLVHSIAGKPREKDTIQSQVVLLLPYSYALMGTLYLGLLCKNIYPDYSMEHILERIQHPYVTLLGLGSLLFWIPAISHKRVLSFLHGLFFFFLLIGDFFMQETGRVADKAVLKNDMKIYTISLLLHLLALLLIFGLSQLYRRFLRSRVS